MNCGLFQNRIYEYLDGSLSPRALAAAEEHLFACAACRQALTREQQTARSLSDKCRRATDSLELPQDFGHKLLTALSHEHHASDMPQGILMLWRRLAWPLAAATSALLLLTGLLIFLFVRSSRPRLAHAQPHSAADGVMIQLSYVVPTYAFRQEGGFVIDALIYRTNVVNQRLPVSRARLE
jgi:anti-sigma factor RsiW